MGYVLVQPAGTRQTVEQDVPAIWNGQDTSAMTDPQLAALGWYLAITTKPALTAGESYGTETYVIDDVLHTVTINWPVIAADLPTMKVAKKAELATAEQKTVTDTISVYDLCKLVSGYASQAEVDALLAAVNTAEANTIVNDALVDAATTPAQVEAL